MNIQPTRTETGYEKALRQTSTLMGSDPELATPEGVRLDVPATLLHAYEVRRHRSLGRPADVLIAETAAS